MKYFCIGLLILCLLLCACYFSARKVDAAASSVLGPLEKALERAGLGDVRGRRAWIDTAQACWQRELPLLTCLLSHSLTGEIGDRLAELRLLEGAEFRRGCALLIRRLQAVREMDRPRPGNVL